MSCKIQQKVKITYEKKDYWPYFGIGYVPVR